MGIARLLSDDFHYIFDGAVEWSVVLQFDGTHGCSKLSGFYRIGSLQTLVEIACRIGIAASRSIHYFMRRVGWNIIESIIYINQRALASQRDDYFGYAPGMNQLGGFLQIIPVR